MKIVFKYINLTNNCAWDTIMIESGRGDFVAVELIDLYSDIRTRYNVKLHTSSCFGKKIGWVHIVESELFAQFLHGNELIFTSGVQYTTEEWLKEFVDMIYDKHAGGLILGLPEGRNFSKEIIEYCNKLQFPLFSASWDTPYIDVMRRFSEILLQNEKKETNLVSALKNAIYYPNNLELYVKDFESNGFFQGMSFCTFVMSCHTYHTEGGNKALAEMKEDLRYFLKKTVLYEENDILIVLAVGDQISLLNKGIRARCKRDDNVYAGAGVTVTSIEEIHKSYKSAKTAYQLTKTTIPRNFLTYEELGIYQLLTDYSEKTIYPNFVEETLGKLIDYDKKNQTDYMHILETYFENECSIICTSKALYCHKNTLSYKIGKIREILGYDMLLNENRMKIMISLRILRLDREYYT